MDKFRKLILILILGIFPFVAIGCSNVIPQDKIPEAVQVTENSVESASYLLLSIVRLKAPEYIVDTEMDLLFLKGELEVIIENEVGVKEVSQVILNTIDRLENRITVLQDEEVKVYIKAAIIALQSADAVVNKYTLPDEVKAIAKAVAHGIDEGVKTYQEDAS